MSEKGSTNQKINKLSRGEPIIYNEILKNYFLNFNSFSYSEFLIYETIENYKKNKKNNSKLPISSYMEIIIRSYIYQIINYEEDFKEMKNIVNENYTLIKSDKGGYVFKFEKNNILEIDGLFNLENELFCCEIKDGRLNHYFSSKKRNKKRTKFEYVFSNLKKVLNTDFNFIFIYNLNKIKNNQIKNFIESKFYKINMYRINIIPFKGETLEEKIRKEFREDVL